MGLNDIFSDDTIGGFDGSNVSAVGDDAVVTVDGNGITGRQVGDFGLAAAKRVGGGLLDGFTGRFGGHAADGLLGTIMSKDDSTE